MSRRPSISGEIFRALIRLFIGILIAFSATLAWTSYSDEARKLVGTWAPAAAWLLPVSPLESPADGHESAQEAVLPQTAPVAQKPPAVPSSDSVRQLEPITRDLAAVQSAEQLSVKQEQMAQAVSSSDSAQQLKPIAGDLAALRSSLEQLALKQEQMAKNIATLQAAVEQDIKEKMSAQLPSQAVPLPQRKPPHAAR
jgi:hypothetical protein